VKANIGKFGGNPDQVTIVGESAGGASVLHLLTSTETKNLFHRVIVMSGGGRRAMLVLGKKMIADNPEKLSSEKPSQEQIDACFSMICRIDPAAPDALKRLRALDANTLVADLDFTSATLAEMIKVVPTFAGTPMIDDWIVKGEPEEILLNSKAAAVPIIIGTVAAEPALYFPPRKAPYPYAYFGDKKAQQDDARAKYGNSPSIAAVAIGIDMSMHEPARFVAKAMTAAGNPAWLYRFSYVVDSEKNWILGPVLAGAAHSTEIPFLFQTLEYRYDKVSDNDRQAAREFSGYFANFAIAKNPDPNFGSLPKWPKFEQTDSPRTQLMNFTFTVKGLQVINPQIEFGDDPIKDHIELVGSVARQP
jgi:para-nitrobenzyl esterase